MGPTTNADAALIGKLTAADSTLRYFYHVSVSIPAEFKGFIYINPDIVLGAIDQSPLVLGRIKKIGIKRMAYSAEGNTLVIGTTEPLK